MTVSVQQKYSRSEILLTNAYDALKYDREHDHIRDRKNKDGDEFGNIIGGIPYTVYYVEDPARPGFALRDASGEKVVERVDLTAYYTILALHPDLDCPDAEIAKKAWIKFLSSPEGLAFRADASLGRSKRTKSDGRIIIK